MKAKKTAGGGGRRQARKIARRAAGPSRTGGRVRGGSVRSKRAASVAARPRTVGIAGRGAKIARRAKPAAKVKGRAGVAASMVRASRPAAGPKFSSPRMQNLAAMLARKGAEILEQIKRAREATVDADRTSFAEVGDLVSASVEKEKAFEYGEAGVNALREIKTALEKLKAGTYGKCERCGKPIGVKRLEVMPSARLCVKCKLREESTGKAVSSPADNAFED